MRIGFVSLIAFTICGAVLHAQHVGVINPSRPPMAAPAGAYQYGNILYPGGVPQNPSQTHAGRLGATISGNPGYTGVGPGPVYPNGGGRNRTIVVPYAYPVYSGGGYDPYYAAQQPNNVTVVVPQSAPANVVINQSFNGSDWQKMDVAGTDTREESGLKVWDGADTRSAAKEKAKQVESRPTRGSVADEKPNIYLIALKDSTVRTAIGYWTDGGTLHYVSPDSSVNHVTLDMVDRELSERLNKDRKLEFELNTSGAPRRP